MNDKPGEFGTLDVHINIINPVIHGLNTFPDGARWVSRGISSWPMLAGGRALKALLVWGSMPIQLPSRRDIHFVDVWCLNGDAPKPPKKNDRLVRIPIMWSAPILGNTQRARDELDLKYLRPKISNLSFSPTDRQKIGSHNAVNPIKIGLSKNGPPQLVVSPLIMSIGMYHHGQNRQSHRLTQGVAQVGSPPWRLMYAP